MQSDKSENARVFEISQPELTLASYKMINCWAHCSRNLLGIRLPTLRNSNPIYVTQFVHNLYKIYTYFIASLSLTEDYLNEVRHEVGHDGHHQVPASGGTHADHAHHFYSLTVALLGKSNSHSLPFRFTFGDYKYVTTHARTIASDGTFLLRFWDGR